MSREMYGVRYYKGDKLKQKEFESLDDARAFYKRCSRRDGEAQLFKFWKENWLEALNSWTFNFNNHDIPVIRFMACWLCVGAIVGGFIWQIGK